MQIPNVDFVIDDFLRPTFAGSPLYEPHTNATGCSCSGWCSARCSALVGIAIAYRVWVAPPGHRRGRARRACAPLYELFVNKWYFDELIDAARRAPGGRRRALRDATRSSACSSTRRSSAAPPGIVRAGSAAVRAAQSGFVRYYAALLVLGVTGVGFYFLLQT